MKRVIIFSIISFFSIASLPLFNIYHMEKIDVVKIFSKEVFTVDKLQGLYNNLLMEVGFTGDVEQAVVGKNGFMFLGNQYSQPINQHTGNYRFTEHEDKSAKTLQKLAQKSTDQNIPSVFLFAPDKESLYSEFLPDWYRYSEDTPFKAILHRMDLAKIEYVDMLPVLEPHKDNQILFFKTDSHWNQYAGYLAYVEALRKLDPTLKVIKPPEFTNVNFLSGEHPRMLKFDSKGEIIPVVQKNIAQAMPMSFCDFSLDVGGEILEENCMESVNYETQVNTKNIVIKNPNALNKKKVLWFRDSFGNAASEFIQDTFEESVQLLNFQLVNDAMIRALLEEYQPDYIMYWSVERQVVALAWFQ